MIVPSAELPTVRVITDDQAWDALAPQWADLFATSPQAATPLQFDWLRTWWQIYGPGPATQPSVGGEWDSRLRIVSFWRASRLVGALPLYERPVTSQLFNRRELWFISTGEDEHEETCPDYLNLLAAPDEGANCVAALEAAFDASNWDCLNLLAIPQDSPLIEGSSWMRGRPGSVTPASACPIANLAGGFERYLARLSANSREQFRRLLRQAEKSGATLQFATEATTDAFFDDLVRLHQQRWVAQRKPGCFAAPRFTRFHRSLASRWVGSGQSMLARLSLNGEAIAVLYGFVTGAKFDFYQSGVQTTSAAFRSPGHVAHLLLMRELCERGIARYDFLRGSSRYKSQLATDTAQLYTVNLWRSAIRASASQVAARVRSAVRDSVPASIRRRLRTRR